MERFFVIFLKGLWIGGTLTVPGVSGGTMAIVMGVYEHLLNAVDHLKDRKNMQFVITLGSGGLVGIVALSGIVTWLLKHHYTAVSFFFIGAVVGGIPAICREMRLSVFKWYQFFYFLGGIVVLRSAVEFHVLVDLTIDVVDRIGDLQRDLRHGAVVLSALQHHHTDLDLVAGIGFAVHQKTVQKRIFRHGAQIRREDQRHVADVPSFFARRIDVLLHRLARDVDGDHIHGIRTLAHNVSRHRIHRIAVLQPFSVCSHK